MAAPPPTPLSGCPLKRLEIHGGSTCNIYDAAHLESSLTATLEAQRSTAGNHNNLLLQSHLGLKRVLSIRLTDLAKSPYNETEIINVDKPSQRIGIQFFQTEQVVLIHFEKRQDFNSTIYMLKRIGFRIKDDISLPLHSCTTNQPAFLSTHGYGPRLSSFTPLQSEGPRLSQLPFSFTSMLNSDVPLTQIQSPGTEYRPIHQSLIQDLSQQPIQQVVPKTAYAPHPNAYQMYLGQQGNMYQPRVSSPLRNTVPISDRSESPTPPISSSQPIYPTDFAAMASLPNYRSISAPNPLSNSWQQPENSGASCHTSLDDQLAPPGSQDSNTSAGNSSQATDEADDAFTLQLSQDFRKFMPRTRSLPFMKDGNHKAVTFKPARKQTNTKDDRSKNKPHNNSHTGRENNEISIDDPDIFIKWKTASEEDNISSSAGSSAGSQLVLRPTSSHSIASQAEATLACHSSLEVAELSTMFIADPTLLEKLNQSTSKLFDQFNADIGRGCDGAAYAEFYLEQIHMVRRDFWLSQLK